MDPWTWFVGLLTSILKGLVGITNDWGLAIIILTVIVRLLITPLMTKSSASSAKMQVLQPELKKIQDKYADDPDRQAREMQAFYAEHKFNPLGGCLPVLLQMPIFFALFQVARDVPKTASLLNIIPSISLSAADAISKWGAGGWIYVALVVLFGGLTAASMLLNAKSTAPEQRRQMIIMGVMMSVMMLWVGWRLPAAVLLYYDTSSIWQLAQQQFITQRVIDSVKKEEAAKLEEQGVAASIDVVRKERKKRPRKKS